MRSGRGAAPSLAAERPRHIGRGAQRKPDYKACSCAPQKAQNFLRARSARALRAAAPRLRRSAQGRSAAYISLTADTFCKPGKPVVRDGICCSRCALQCPKRAWIIEASTTLRAVIASLAVMAIGITHDSGKANLLELLASLKQFVAPNLVLSRWSFHNRLTESKQCEK